MTNIDTDYIELIKKQFLIELASMNLSKEELEKIKNISIYDNELIEKSKKCKNKLKYKCLSLVAYSIDSVLSVHHKEDMKFFAEYSEEEYKDKEYIIEFLCDMATDEALQNENYRDFFNLVKTAKTEKNAECASFVANSILPFQSLYQLKDMNLVVNAKTDEIAIDLKNVSLSEMSIHSEYHSETMNLIASAKLDDTSRCISIFACCSKIPFNNYKNFIDVAATIKIDKISYELDSLVNGLSLFNGDDFDLNSLRILAKMKSKIDADFLLNILYSLNSSLSKKERFEKAVNFALMKQCDLKDVDITAACNAAVLAEIPSIVPKKVKY